MILIDPKKLQHAASERNMRFFLFIHHLLALEVMSMYSQRNMEVNRKQGFPGVYGRKGNLGKLFESSL